MRFIDSANEVLNEKLRQSHIAAHYLSLKESVDEKYINVFPERVQNYITKLALILSDLCEDEEVEKKDNYNNGTYFLAAIEFLCLNLINNDYLHKTLKALNESGNRAKHTISEINLKSNMYKYVDAYNLMISELIDHTKLTSLSICKLNKKDNDDEKDIQPEVTAEVSDPCCSICGLMNLKSINIRYYKCRKCHSFVCVDCYSIEKKSCINCTKIKDFDYYLEKAEQGDASSQVKVANCYFTGTETDEDKEEAFKWFMKAAEQNEPEGQFMVGQCYYEGEGVNENKEISLEWSLKAANQGHGGAQLLVGLCYYHGNGTKLDKQEAFNWFLKSAENGDETAQYNVGYCYFHGEGVDENKEESFKWLFKSAENGYTIAQYDVGYCYFYGEGIDENKDEAFKWFDALKDIDYPEAQNMLGECYYHGYGVTEDKKKAFELFNESIKNGCLDACYNIGLCYFNGEGIEEDIEEGFSYFQKAADNENTKAYYMLGHCYYNGKGVEQNNEIALSWYKRAAEHGNTEAQKYIDEIENEFATIEQFNSQLKLAEDGDPDSQYYVGDCYYNGKGTNTDFNNAFEWFKKSAEQGNSDAQYMTGYCLYHGKGIEKNNENSLTWLYKSADNGNENASKMIIDCFGISKRSDDIVIKHGDSSTITHESLSVSWNREEATVTTKNLKLNSDEHSGSLEMIFWFSNKQYLGKKGQLDDAYIMGEKIFWKEGLSKGQYWEKLETKIDFAGNPPTGEYYVAITINEYHEGEKCYIIDWHSWKELYYWEHSEKIEFNKNLKLAENGDSEAQYEVGKSYYYGNGIEKDLAKAFYWYLQSANQNDPDAQCMVGCCYYKGEGIEKDLHKAFEYFLKSANQDDSYAEYMVGNCYYKGEGIEKDLHKAFEYFLKSANQNDPDAQYMIGNYYFRGYDEGQVVNKDKNNAFLWYKKSAENGCLAALNMLAECYYNGYGTEKDVPTAIECIKKTDKENARKWLKEHTIYDVYME